MLQTLRGPRAVAANVAVVHVCCTALFSAGAARRGYARRSDPKRRPEEVIREERSAPESSRLAPEGADLCPIVSERARGNEW
jgi:hypothetical protein